MPGAAPAHRSIALLVLCLSAAVMVAASASSGALSAGSAAPNLWAVELGPSDGQFARKGLRRLRSGGLNTVVVDARRVGTTKRASFAKAARAAGMSFVVGSATCRLDQGCWRIVASPAGARAVRAKGHTRVIVRLREPSAVASLAGVAPRVLGLVRLDARSFSESAWETAVADAQKLPGVELGITSVTSDTSRSVELFRGSVGRAKIGRAHV